MRNALVLLPLLVSCSDYDLTAIEDNENIAPIIEVAPAQVIFSGVEVGSTATEIFTISNVGNARLEIEAMNLQGSDTFALTDLSAVGYLSPDESVDVAVEFTPYEDGAEEIGTVIIRSTDPASPNTPVELWAGVNMPMLQVTPDPLDFGSVLAGQEKTMTLTLTSVGDSPVSFSGFDITGTEFTGYENEAWPMTLPPGGVTTMDITLVAEGGGVINETITVDVDAPGSDASAELTASVGDGGPIAVCSVSPTEVQPNRDTADWIGRESYDTDGYRITTWDWTLYSQPGGSTAFMPPGGADRNNFAPDLAGEYVGQLIVKNELGVESEPCYATLTGTPYENLWIQMYWAHNQDDMDLHLLAPGGTLESNRDCYYANCVPSAWSGLDWGVSGDASDDPALDMDDIPGTGPENINIEYPENGVFTVYVHDFSGSTADYHGGNDVTVVIYLGGTQVWTDTRSISGDGSYVPFAEIEWPAGIVTGL
jgi:hypothetical protein